jgi:CRISPR system Cascade subunit CasA
MGKFNLLQEPWIAVMDGKSGEKKEVSLIDLFRNAENYQTLAGEMQTQNFVILRFLLSIVQTVFSRYDCDGNLLPGIELDEIGRQAEAVDEDDLEDYRAAVSDCWNQLYSLGKFPEIVIRYLNSWQDRFFLFDETHPFYQVNKQEMDEILKHASKGKAQSVYGKTINRTISESENKRALFAPVSNTAINKRSRLDVLTSDEIARWLLMYHSYSGTGDKVKYLNDNQGPSKGWLFDLGGICLQGDTLFETLVMNYMPESPTEREDLAGRIQRPCWEYSGGEVVQRLYDGTAIDNLAELYTNWSRAVYLDPDTDVSAPMHIDVVKLPEIDHSENSIEPMTIWKWNENGISKDHFTLKKHNAEQALWRSFGLIAAKSSDIPGQKQRQPGIYLQYERLARVKGSRWTNIVGISMKDNGNAASWLPVDEITDQFRINDIVLTDQDPDGWVIRITNAVEVTKNTVSGIFRNYLKGICEIRNLKLKPPVDPLAEGFIETETALLYENIDAYFKEWLVSLQPESSKDDAVSNWYRQLKQLVLERGTELFENSTARDLMGIKKENGYENIATKYWQFVNRLNNRFGKEEIH